MPETEKKPKGSARRYSKNAEAKIEEVMEEFKDGDLKSSSGDKVTK